MSEEFLIRCETRRYSVTVDAEREIFDTSPPELVYRKFKVLKRTPKGAWIDPEDWCQGWVYLARGDKRFVLLSGRKQFASETEEEALDQFRHRKLSQVRTLSARLRRAKEDLELAKRTQAAQLTPEDRREIGQQESEIWQASNYDRGA